MGPDPEYLRKHYSSLSDEALLAIDRDDLLELAQSLYDAEMVERGLGSSREVAAKDGSREWAVENDEFSNLDESSEVEENEDAPAWLDGAAEVYSVVALPRRNDQERVADARQALEAAGIPCHLEQVELIEEAPTPVGTHRWRILVPGKLELQAISTLERDLSNADFEAGWRMLLEECSDSELRKMDPETVFCGLFDRVHRVKQAYEEEFQRRRLKMKSH